MAVPADQRSWPFALLAVPPTEAAVEPLDRIAPLRGSRLANRTLVAGQRGSAGGPGSVPVRPGTVRKYCRGELRLSYPFRFYTPTQYCLERQGQGNCMPVVSVLGNFARYPGSVSPGALDRAGHLAGTDPWRCGRCPAHAADNLGCRGVGGRRLYGTCLNDLARDLSVPRCICGDLGSRDFAICRPSKVGDLLRDQDLYIRLVLEPF